MDTATKIRQIVSEQLDVALESVTDQARFIEDLGADSLAIVELALAFENEFGVSIPDEVTSEIQTVADVIGYVLSQKAA